MYLGLGFIPLVVLLYFEFRDVAVFTLRALFLFGFIAVVVNVASYAMVYRQHGNIFVLNYVFGVSL